MPLHAIMRMNAYCVATYVCFWGLSVMFLSKAHAATSLHQGLVSYQNYEQATPVDVSGNQTLITHQKVVGQTLQGHYSSISSLAGNAGFYNRSQSAYSKIPLSFGSEASALGYHFSVSAWYYLQPLTLDPSGDKRMFVYEGDDHYELSYYIKGLFDAPTGGAYKYEGVLSTNGPINNIGVATSFNEDTKIGSWNHIIDTYSLTGTTVTKLTYFNGTLINSVTRSINPTDASPFRASSGINLGTYRDNNGRFWDGFLDEVGVWNRTLSASEVNALYQLNLAGFSLVPEPSKVLLSFIGLSLLFLRRSSNLPRS